MARPNQASIAKRNRERAKQEKQADKRANKANRKEQKKIDSPGDLILSELDDLKLGGLNGITRPNS